MLKTLKRKWGEGGLRVNTPMHSSPPFPPLPYGWGRRGDGSESGEGIRKAYKHPSLSLTLKYIYK